MIHMDSSLDVPGISGDPRTDQCNDEEDQNKAEPNYRKRATAQGVDRELQASNLAFSLRFKTGQD